MLKRLTLITLLFPLFLAVNNFTIEALETTGTEQNLPQLKIGIIKHQPEAFQENDPSVLYTNVIEKTQKLLRDHSDINLIVFPEWTFFTPIYSTWTSQDLIYSETVYPAIEVICPSDKNSCDLIPHPRFSKCWIVKEKMFCQYADISHPISQKVVDSLQALQELAKQYGVEMVVGTVNELLPNPGNIPEIPSGYIHFNSILIINKNGEIKGIRRKTASDGHWGEICQNLESAQSEACTQATRELALKTIRPHYFSIVGPNGDIEISYFSMICIDRYDEEMMKRAVAQGIHHLDLLIHPEYDYNNLDEYEPIMDSIQKGAWQEDNFYWKKIIATGLIKPFVDTYEIIKKYGFVVIADGYFGTGGILQLNSPPEPLGNYNATNDYVFGTISLAQLKPEALTAPTQSFIRGDANSDNHYDISDAIFLLHYLFLGGRAPQCLDPADTNDDGKVNITDAIYIINDLFLDGPPPSLPFPLPGSDPTPDSLGCI